MMKKILIGVGVLVLVLGVAFMYLMHRNRTLSPPCETHFKLNGVEISAFYSGPSVRERVIFGDNAEEVLLPYGKYWRLGGNESTEIELSQDFSVMGNKLAAGRHKVYCYPAKESFEFCFAPADGAWGAMEPDRSLEYFSVQIPVNKMETPVEQFTISFTEKNDVILMNCAFADHMLSVPFKAE